MLINDSELGNILLVGNSKARHVTARYKDGCFRITYPSGANVAEVRKIVVGMKPKLLRLKANAGQKAVWQPGRAVETNCFNIIVEESRYSNFYSQLSGKDLKILCPQGCDYSDAAVGQTIQLIVEGYLRAEAKRILPERVRCLANEFGFTYTGVKINKSESRWGSCSSRKSINLSLKCMLLPAHLIDLVVLHELCHTVEMNHGERFWSLLDKVTGGQSQALTKELKDFKSPF